MWTPAILCGALLTGCGPSYIDTVKVEGTIKYKGEPVEGASIMFSPIDDAGAPAYGRSDANGKYVIQTQQGKIGAGTVPGQYKVSIRKSVDVPSGKTRPKPEGGEEPILIGKEMLPAQYKFADKSPINATVEDGKDNVIDFNLE